MTPTCRLGGVCVLVSRDAMLSPTVMGATLAGVAQCTRCSTVWETTGWRPRHCGHCGQDWGVSLHDPCLGRIDGATEACCGHGDPAAAYVLFGDGRRLEGTACQGRL